jgi:hypothetical protein
LADIVDVGVVDLDFVMDLVPHGRAPIDALLTEDGELRSNEWR